MNCLLLESITSGLSRTYSRYRDSYYSIGENDSLLEFSHHVFLCSCYYIAIELLCLDDIDFSVCLGLSSD